MCVCVCVRKEVIDGKMRRPRRRRRRTRTRSILGDERVVVLNVREKEIEVGHCKKEKKERERSVWDKEMAYELAFNFTAVVRVLRIAFPQKKSHTELILLFMMA